ncbi:MAG: hypothetical protein ACRD0O_16135 [Acidimicrobiia bacterium]
MPGVIDDRRWIEQRLKFLRERLAAGPSDDERQAIEAEIEALSARRRRTPFGRPRGLPRLPRRKKSG